MDDLLKDAIADAKAVRETAIANAKIALEEAFTPKLQNMLSQKIQNEIEDEDEVEDMEDEMGDEEQEEGAYHEDDEVPGDDVPADDEGEEEEVEESDIIEIDGVKYAPVVSEEDDEMEDDEEVVVPEEDEEEEDDLDLEGIIKELESELDESEEVEESKEEVEESEEEKEDEEVNEGPKDEEGEDDSEPVSEDKEEVKEEDDFNLDEILDALKEEDKTEESVDETSKLKAELEETREAVKFMRSKLNEVNLLNAKLLFTNKLFRAYGLNNEQKMKVVETFDRATNIREVKLVYSTMAETFGAKKTEIKESKGSASKAVASTKSDTKAEVITEGDTMRDRFKKLANII